MALTPTEKARIRKLLGWGARFWQLYTRLENAMDAVEQTLPEETGQIQGILTQLTDIDAKISDALGTVGVTGVSTIHLDSDQGISHLKSEGRRLVEGIAVILQVDIKKNFYANGGMRGGYLQYG
jgi:hypothetical protein